MKDKPAPVPIAPQEATLPPQDLTAPPSAEGTEETLVLAVLWCRDEPQRAGEVLLLPSGAGGGEGSSGAPWTFGRGEVVAGERRLGLVRLRPGGAVATGPLQCPRVSRDQLRIAAGPDGTAMIENAGRCQLLHAGRAVSAATPRPGDVLELQNELMLLCVRRPARIAWLPDMPSRYPFGEPDAAGLLGESAAIWELRRQIAAIASLGTHVLVLGESGSGKELVARAVHRLSSRGAKPLVARNAATIPEGLADAELFGNLRNYPHPGMPERPGLVGEAAGASLFLDEVAELPVSLQARLLRLMDDGEHQRLGESTSRRADLRVIGATNRPVSSLKHDVLARFKSRLQTPGLDVRREDIPLLAAHVLRRHARESPALAAQFFPGGDPSSHPRISPTLLRSLAEHRYTTHVRELDALLLHAALASRGKYIEPAGEPFRTSAAETAKAAGAPPDAPAVTPPLQSAPSLEEALTAEERLRLDLQRRHGFRATDCGQDPAYPGNRQTADFHLRHLACKALRVAAWDVSGAARLLAGEEDLAARSKLEKRIGTFLDNLDRHRAELDLPGLDPGDGMRRFLTEEWRGSLGTVLEVVDALRRGHLRGRPTGA